MKTEASGENSEMVNRADQGFARKGVVAVDISGSPVLRHPFASTLQLIHRNLVKFTSESPYVAIMSLFIVNYVGGMAANPKHTIVKIVGFVGRSTPQRGIASATPERRHVSE